ncbi:CMP-sialic acid transporter 5-like isoform X2 [Salvia splendens]|uniref:CMP-sialic acid transporter 5-like isoform X2 n=1 Tax=Salvia splendens TaxID=180675 RepID=UPI001C266215|nr:CMP-sialic acid transporter 5-like isoform X2 [Salvia splendens]
MKNGMIECSVCHSKIVNPSTKAVSRAYDRHRNKISSKQRALNFLLVGGDCVLVGFQPILVYMSKVDGRFKFSPISVNFLTEVAKVFFAITMLLLQARQQKVGEKPLLSLSTFMQDARNNKLLAVPALLYAINNYLKFTMQLYFNPATVKMLSNLKVLVIAVLLKFIMKRRFSVIQWEALALLLIGISINQLKSMPVGTTALDLPISTVAYICTLIFVTVPSMASVFNEYALKSQYDTSIYLQNLFLYGYGAIFNFLGILGTVIFKGPNNFSILEGHSKATMFLICNNAAQGILSSFFFKYAGIASAALFGHTLTINFLLGISVVFISMHQFFSPLAKAKDEEQNAVVERADVQDKHRSRDSSFINMTAGANEEASRRVGPDERQPLLPT